MARIVRQTDANECRRCSTFCDRVIAPAACVAAGLPVPLLLRRAAHRPPLHGLHAEGVRDRDRRRAVPRRRSARGRASATVRLAGYPLARCAFEVEQAREGREEPCVNPRFFDWPDAGRDGIRAFDLRDQLLKLSLQRSSQAGAGHKMQTPRAESGRALALMDSIRRGNYDSGQDYVLEYGELRFTFNERDFSERVEQSARKLGLRRRAPRRHRARGPRQPVRQRRGPGPRLRPGRARQRLLARAGRPRRALARALAAPARVPLRLAGPAGQGG